jgi:hypothetical protein
MLCFFFKVIINLYCTAFTYLSRKFSVLTVPSVLTGVVSLDSATACFSESVREHYQVGTSLQLAWFAAGTVFFFIISH